MVTTPDSDNESLASVLSDRLGAAKAKRREAATALETARRAEDTWQALLDAVRAERCAEVVHIFRRESALFSALRAQKDPSVPILENLYRSSEQKALEAARRFPSTFPEACTENGVQLDTTSRHPRYTVKEFIEVLVDDRALEATVAPRDGQPTSIPLDVAPVAERLHVEIARLFEKQRDLKRLLSGLRKAYHAVIREEKRKTGDDLPLRRVANRLSKNWAHFRYDEFNVDLARIIRDGPTNVDNERLHLNHTRDTRQGMLLHGLERGGYLGFISFKPEDSNA